jgi:endonuclease YncB( thermonuclease family)
LGKTLTIKSLYVGKHGRCIARVFSPEQKELNLELVKAGLAWWYQRYAPYAWNYMEAMLKAHKKGVGLWSLKEPTPPWVRRMGKKSKRLTGKGAWNG